MTSKFVPSLHNLRTGVQALHISKIQDGGLINKAVFNKYIFYFIKFDIYGGSSFFSMKNRFRYKYVIRFHVWFWICKCVFECDIVIENVYDYNVFIALLKRTICR